MHDVIVIGAGPAGLHVARRLAENGLDVVVLESKSEIGKDIVCTGIVSQKAFEEFNLSRDSILNEINKIKLVSPFVSSLSYEHPYPFACVIDREKFDKDLAYKACQEGARIKLRSKVINISINRDSVEVLTKVEEKYNEKYSAETVIIATGVDYKLHKALGLGYPKEFLNGAQAELKIDKLDCTSVYVGRDIAPGGFAWIVPVEGEIARIGLMTKKNPKFYFEHFLEKLYPESLGTFNKNLIQFKPIAQGLVSQTYGERVLSVGEAAGQVKTTTGGGIYFGLFCSEILSNVMIKRFNERNFSTRALAEYETLWKNYLKEEILIGYYTRKIFRRLSDAQIERVIQIAANDGVIPLVRDRGNFDWHTDLIFTLFKTFPLIKILMNSKD